MSIMCIYKISINNECYIGSAVDYDRRIRKHKKLLLENKHHSPILQNYYNKYSVIIVDILEVVSDRKNLLNREQYYMDELKPKLNACKHAGSMLGFKHSEKTRKKLAEIHTGKYKKEEHPNYGRKHSKEFCDKNRERSLGKKYSDEVNKKKGLPGKSNPFFGRKHSEETKKKWSEKRKGQMAGEKHPMFGKKHSEETKEIIRQKAILQFSKNI